jgi:hypothetical protein
LVVSVGGITYESQLVEVRLPAVLSCDFDGRRGQDSPLDVLFAYENILARVIRDPIPFGCELFLSRAMGK